MKSQKIATGIVSAFTTPLSQCSLTLKSPVQAGIDANIRRVYKGALFMDRLGGIYPHE